MGNRAQDLAARIRALNDEVIAFTANCTEENWRKRCSPEDWPVGVVARHIGSAHFNIIGLVKMVLKSEKLPVLTREQITEMANQHARENANCTKDEVLDILKEHGEGLAEFVTTLNDTDLDRAGYLAFVGRDMSIQQLIENVILRSGGNHFASMKAAIGQ